MNARRELTTARPILINTKNPTLVNAMSGVYRHELAQLEKGKSSMRIEESATDIVVPVSATSHVTVQFIIAACAGGWLSFAILPVRNVEYYFIIDFKNSAMFLAVEQPKLVPLVKALFALQESAFLELLKFSEEISEEALEKRRQLEALPKPSKAGIATSVPIHYLLGARSYDRSPGPGLSPSPGAGTCDLGGQESGFPAVSQEALFALNVSGGALFSSAPTTVDSKIAQKALDPAAPPRPPRKKDVDAAKKRRI
ncbi:MAG TPA: hypothetical protein VNC84_01595 [Gammaproteobacteria bacterium]|jgi:hypothetical protein|nr:hypothetical protein [Gammaproteobacteria bacterium]